MIKDLLYKQCPTCNGKGYQGVPPASIKDAFPIEQNNSVAERTVGALVVCQTCLGRGAIKKDKE